MSSREKEKKEWAHIHALRIESLFEKWQRPLGINGKAYSNALAKELPDVCDEPLRKSLIESMS